MKLKINQKHFIEIENIDHIVAKSDKCCWVYLKSGYPKILKTDCSYVNLMARIANTINFFDPDAPARVIPELKALMKEYTETTECSICSSKFELETEGGIIGEIGILPVQFCPTCLNGILDLAEQLRCEDD